MNELFDLAIIGAGEAGQAAHLARKLGSTVAIIDRELFGGSCPDGPASRPRPYSVPPPSMHWAASFLGSVHRTFATG